jgi:chorismate dehydratase
VPSRLAPRLLAGEFDAALVPVVELLRPEAGLTIVSDACIAADGETLTVRVFSKIPPGDIRRMWVDSDSRSSVTLARVMWPDLYGTDVEFVPLPEGAPVEAFDTVLLIGDKVVAVEPRTFRYQVDLGGAWKTWTGLPFVFAVWAAPRGRAGRALTLELNRARDRGVTRLAELAVEHGPLLGWPVELAQEYLLRYIRYALTEKYVEGMVRFLDLARGHLPWAQPQAGSGLGVEAQVS